MRFHSLPATLSTSFTLAYRLLAGHWSNNSLLIASVFSRGYEIVRVCELTVKPNASIVVSQSVLFFGARIGVSPSAPGPNNRTWSDAREADATRAVLSLSDCCTLTYR